METLDRTHCFAFENESITHRLHAEHADLLAHENRQNVLPETTEVCVQHVERHLHRVETEAMRRGHLEHPQVHERVLVTSEANEADLACLPRCGEGLLCSAFGKNAVRVFHPKNFVVLNQIDDIGLQPTKRLVELL